MRTLQSGQLFLQLGTFGGVVFIQLQLLFKVAFTYLVLLLGILPGKFEICRQLVGTFLRFGFQLLVGIVFLLLAQFLDFGVLLLLETYLVVRSLLIRHLPGCHHSIQLVVEALVLLLDGTYLGLDVSTGNGRYNLLRDFGVVIYGLLLLLGIECLTLDVKRFQTVAVLFTCDLVVLKLYAQFLTLVRLLVLEVAVLPILLMLPPLLGVLFFG